VRSHPRRVIGYSVLGDNAPESRRIPKEAKVLGVDEYGSLHYTTKGKKKGTIDYTIN
jgi:hypothetical protein